MSDDYESFSDYWKQVQTDAVIELNEAEEWAENNHQITDNEKVASGAARATEHNNLPMYYPRTIIYHTDQGFTGQGSERYIQHREFKNNDSHEILNALAHAAYYNDVKSVMENIIEWREDLGEATKLIDDTLWSKGVEVEYEFDPTGRDETFTFELEHLGAREWRMTDPEGEPFEVISPEVHFENSEQVIPERTLSIWLDNICYRRIREMEQDG